VETQGEAERRPSQLVVGIGSVAEPVVVDEKVSALLREIVEKVNERVAGQD
jgi:hypothetical protein